MQSMAAPLPLDRVHTRASQQSQVEQRLEHQQ
jgi:hypothetical protein